MGIKDNFIKMMQLGHETSYGSNLSGTLLFSDLAQFLRTTPHVTPSSQSTDTLTIFTIKKT